MNQNKDSLRWALNRLAQLQGAYLDPIRVEAALSELPDHAGAAALHEVCSKLEMPAPKTFAVPDPARLPALALHSQEGWGVVVEPDPTNAWAVEFQSGARLCEATEIECAWTSVATKAGDSSGQRPSFSEVVKAAMRRYRGSLVEAALATVFMSLLTLAVSLFSMQVYDRVIPTKSESTLVILGAGVILAVLIELAMKFARSHVMDAVTTGVDSRLSRDIFQRLLSVRIDRLPASVGSLAGQIRGYEQVRSFYTASTLFTLVDLPMSVIFLLVIALIGTPVLALPPLVLAAVAIAMGAATQRKIARLADEGAAASTRKTGLLVEAVEGAETIKSGSGGWKMLSRWIDLSALGIVNDLRMRGASETLGYFSAALQQISYAALVAVGAWEAIQGNITMGAVIASSILGGRVMAPVLMIPSLMVQRAHARAAMKGLEKMYELDGDHPVDQKPLVPQALKGDYRLERVRFSYPESPPAIAVEKLAIAAGESIGVLGPIGSGKSTLLRVLAGLYAPQEGRALLSGLDLNCISRPVVTRDVGYLQQDHRLFAGTMRENLLIGLPDPGDDAIQAAMARTGLDKVVAAHPKGLDRPISEGGKGLSGGQRQLMAFTRLLLSDPSILLLDEPTASMHEEQEARCVAVLAEEAAKGKTLIIVTHKPALLTLVRRLIVVTNNQIALDGARDAVLAHLRRMQAGGAQAPAQPSVRVASERPPQPSLASSTRQLAVVNES